MISGSWLALAGVTHRQLAVHEIEGKHAAAHAKFDAVHEQLSKVTAKHDELVAARRAGDTSDKTAAQLYAVAQDKQQLESIAGSAPAPVMPLQSVSSWRMRAPIFAKQQSDRSSTWLAKTSNASRVLTSNAFAGLDRYARLESPGRRGSIFSVVKIGEKIRSWFKTAPCLRRKQQAGGFGCWQHE